MMLYIFLIISFISGVLISSLFWLKRVSTYKKRHIEMESNLSREKIKNLTE